jgi:hypothetical protein
MARFVHRPERSAAPTGRWQATGEIPLAEGSNAPCRQRSKRKPPKHYAIIPERAEEIEGIVFNDTRVLRSSVNLHQKANRSWDPESCVCASSHPTRLSYRSTELNRSPKMAPDLSPCQPTPIHPSPSFGRGVWCTCPDGEDLSEPELNTLSSWYWVPLTRRRRVSHRSSRCEVLPHLG